MFNTIGLESLVQRGRSPMFEDLITLFKDSFKALGDRPEPSQEKIFLTLKKMGFDVRLIDIVKKHMNLPIARMEIEESKIPNLYCGLMLTKMFRKTTTARVQTPGTLMEQISKVYDDRKAQIIIKDTDNFPYKFRIGVMTGLWTITEDGKTFYFTAENLAAMVLHELGHANDFIKTAYRVHFRNHDTADLIDYMGKSPTKEELLKLVRIVKASPYLDKSWSGVLKVVETHFNEKGVSNDPEHYEALSSLITAVTAEASSVNLRSFLEILSQLHGGQVLTRMVLVDQERAADDFAARSGAYRDLIESVSKMNQLATTKTDLIFRQYLWYTPALAVGLLYQFMQLFNINSEDATTGYDPILRRLELIRQTAKHAFSDAGLSDEAKADINEQLIMCDKYIHESQSSAHQRIRATVTAWKNSVVKYGRVIASPVQNRLEGDYERLQNSTRDLSRHNLYYLAQRK